LPQQGACARQQLPGLVEPPLGFGDSLARHRERSIVSQAKRIAFDIAGDAQIALHDLDLQLRPG